MYIVSMKLADTNSLLTVTQMCVQFESDNDGERCPMYRMQHAIRATAMKEVTRVGNARLFSKAQYRELRDRILSYS